MPHKLYLVLFVFAPLFLNAQTCIIVKYDKITTTITAGADSRRMVTKMIKYKNGRQVVDTIYQSICKIHCVGNFNFAIAGKWDNEVKDIATKVCRSHNTLSEVVRSFSEYTQQRLGDSLNRLRELFPNIYEKLNDAPYIGDIIFWEFEKNKPALIKISFGVKDIDAQPPQLGFIPTSDSDAYSIGETWLIRDGLNNDKTWKTGTIPTIKRLINIQKHADSLHVGPPIDIMVLTRQNKRQWKCRKSFCPIAE